MLCGPALADLVFKHLRARRAVRIGAHRSLLLGREKSMWGRPRSQAWEPCQILALAAALRRRKCIRVFRTKKTAPAPASCCVQRATGGRRPRAMAGARYLSPRVGEALPPGSPEPLAGPGMRERIAAERLRRFAERRASGGGGGSGGGPRGEQEPEGACASALAAARGSHVREPPDRRCDARRGGGGAPLQTLSAPCRTRSRVASRRWTGTRQSARRALVCVCVFVRAWCGCGLPVTRAAHSIYRDGPGGAPERADPYVRGRAACACTRGVVAFVCVCVCVRRVEGRRRWCGLWRRLARVTACRSHARGAPAGAAW